MKRRAALAALLGIGAAPVAPAATSASAAPTPPVAAPGLLVRGATGSWVGRPDGGLLRLLLQADAAVAPVPIADGLWALQGGRELQRWHGDDRGGWQIAAAHAFDDDVHALAASPDGRHVLAAHGRRLSLLDRDAGLLRRYDGTDLGRRRRGAARALFHLGGRRSFVADWPDLGEIWEISLDPAAAPIYDGLVHDYRMGEGIATPGHLGVRRTPLETPMAEVKYTDDRLPWVAGRLGDRVQIVHLDVRRRIAQWRQPGAAPHAGLLRRQDGAWAWWLPVAASVLLVDTGRWQPLARIEALGTVRALQALGDAVWALCDVGAAATLAVWRGRSWIPVPLPAGVPVAMHADADGRRLLVAATDPSQLHLLDADGRARQVWALPDDADLRQVRWLPRAA